MRSPAENMKQGPMSNFVLKKLQRGVKAEETHQQRAKMKYVPNKRYKTNHAIKDVSRST